MDKNKNYIAIDYFRIFAALLIVAIHTSPLASVSERGDFILTGIIGRVAVPFFFITSGFFVISRYSDNSKKLISFIKRTTLIYVFAILIYIPVNIYNGYFSMEYLLPNIIKDILFDGTLYHLWYLPASIFAAVISWYLVKAFDYKKAFILVGLLYLIALLGDSYYGVSEKIYALEVFYNMPFQVSDYTRNGILFAPIFFLIGGFISDKGQRVSFKRSIFGFIISFILLFIESILLKHLNMQRHNSMYIFLLPSMYFLFNIILYFRGKRIKWQKTSSLIIYIIHPMMIIVVRLFAKIFHLKNLLIENSIVHYIAVSFLSVVFGVSLSLFLDKYKTKISRYKSYNSKGGRAYVEIDLTNLEHNARVLQEAMPEKCELMAVVKAEAYGHGAFEVSRHLNKIGVKTFAVATIDEGIRLRKYGVKGEILVLGYTDINRTWELKKYDLSQTLIGFEYANALNEKGLAVKAHIKIDTGMGRLGISSKESFKVKSVFSMKNIRVCGIFTHLSSSGSLLPDDLAFTKEQIKSFYDLIDILKCDGISIPKIHIQSSYGLLNYPELKCDYVRVGIALYGVLSSPDDDTRLKLDLRPVLTLKSQVVLIRPVKKGDRIGYDRKFTAKRDSQVAILPMGYADGLPRNLSCGKGSVLINQCRVPIIGAICMDQLLVDVTDVENVVIGSIATIIGGDGTNELSAPDIAKKSGSISNELLSRMGRG